jgi:hypothetical protein
VNGRWTRRGLCLTRRIRSVFSVYAYFSFLIGRTARPVTTDRRVRSLRELTGLQQDTGTVASSQFCSASSRCFVGRCLGLTSASGPLRDQRVQSCFARPVRMMSDEHVWLVLREHRRCAIGTSGQCDQSVRSARLQLFRVSNGYIQRCTSINTHWPAQGSFSWTFDILVSTLS